MSGGSRQPLQPKILLSVMDLLTSRTASNLPGSQPTLHPQVSLGMVPPEEQRSSTFYPRGQDPMPAPTPPRGATQEGSSLCCPKRKQSLQITPAHLFYNTSGGKMTMVTSLLNPLELRAFPSCSVSKTRQFSNQDTSPTWPLQIQAQP